VYWDEPRAGSATSSPRVFGPFRTRGAYAPRPGGRNPPVAVAVNDPPRPASRRSPAPSAPGSSGRRSARLTSWVSRDRSEGAGS
jgi:hypothetical protein